MRSGHGHDARFICPETGVQGRKLFAWVKMTNSVARFFELCGDFRGASPKDYKQ